VGSIWCTAHDWLTANTLAYVRDGWGTPGILTMHSTEYGRDGNVFHDGMARWIRDTEAAGCRHARLVIAVSSFLASELQRIYGVPHDRIHVVPNGVAYHQFDGFIDPGPVKGRYAIGPMDPTLFASGRMMAQKGMDLLVEAVPMVLASYPSAKFVIAGEGPEKAAVVARAHEVGAAGDPLPRRPPASGVHRPGEGVRHRRGAEPQRALRDRRARGVGGGQARRRDHRRGPREFVWHDVNGFLVDANPGGLAHGIGSLLADHDHCRALGRNGRIAVEDRFNWDNVARYTEGVYQAALC
jgi:glycosyltransferase involved in cell wall biosynthesis